MATVNYDQIFKEIGDNIISLAETTASNYKDEAIQDAEQIVADMSDDLKRWTALIADNQITTAEFEWLVNSEKSMLVLKGLEKAGLAAIRIEQFAGSVLNLIADAVLKYVVPALM